MKRAIAILTMGLVYGTAQATTYVDNFNRADGSLGANWTIAGGDYAITNEQVAVSTSGNVVAYWNKGQTLNSGTNGFAISTTVSLNADVNSAWTGLAFNYQNPSNYYEFRYSGTGEVQVLRFVDGSAAAFYNPAGTEFAHVPNRPYRLEVSSISNYTFRATIKDTVTGALVWEVPAATDGTSSFTDGYGGYYSSSLGKVLFDDFELTSEVFQDDYTRIPAIGTFNTDASVSIGTGYALSQLAGDKVAQARTLNGRIQLQQTTTGSVSAGNVVLRYTGLELANTAGSNESFTVEGDIISANTVAPALLYGLAFNYQPDGSFYTARINTGNAATALQFVRYNSAGAASSFYVATNSVPIAITTTNHLVITSSEPGVFNYALTGPSIDGGCLTGTATDTVLKLANGQAGFYASACNTSILFDNLFIKVTRAPLVFPSTGYDAWASNWGVDIGASTNDYDGDGLLNIYEYGLGGDPTNSFDQGISPGFAIQNVGGTNYFGYVHPQLAADQNSGLSYYLELTPDLVIPSWTNADYLVYGTNVTGGTFDYVTNITGTVESKKFIRLIIE
ncbi:MAG: hypothetical protein K9M54_00960 [Kiritimatiellales bacterium]|nr:hypothetical protein [Kiritimatiellales bacterium]